MTVVYKFKNKFYESFNLAMQDFITFVIEQCMGYETENEISFEDRNSSLEHDEMMFYGAWYSGDCPLQRLYELGMVLVRKFTYNNTVNNNHYSIREVKLTDNPTVCLFNLTDKEKYVEYFKSNEQSTQTRNDIC
jgi:hypothetical protein